MEMQNTDRLCMGCMNDGGGEQVCPICGYEKDTPQNTAFLPTRTWLKDRYLLGKVLDSNGEGVTYIGWDNESDTVVYIREYCPSGVSQRGSSGLVQPVAGFEYTFQEGLLAFVRLAQSLVNMQDKSGVLPVYDIFKGNGTAYYVMETVSGITLREFLLRNGGSLTWDQVRPLFLPLVQAVSTLHSAGIIHQGISPDTLLVGRDGKIRLTGFCIPATRTARSDMTAQLFPGFAALEQYGFDGEPGAWTDVYGLAATLFRILVGNPPPEANDRVTQDKMMIPGKVAQTVPQYVLAALANALQILPQDRTQSMDEFLSDLNDVGAEEYDEDPEDMPRKSKKSGKRKTRRVVVAIVVTVLVLVAIFFALALTVFRETFFPVENTPSNVLEPSGSITSLSPAENNETYYSVPNMTGLTFAEVSENSDYLGIFSFEISDAQYSEEYDRGQIISQEPAAGETVERETTVKFVISLGSSSTTMPDVSGLTAEEAMIELLRQGFFYDAISVMDTYDAIQPGGTVVETDPPAGTDLSVGAAIKIFVNTYEEPSVSSASSVSVTVTVNEDPVPSSTPSTSHTVSSSDSSSSGSSGHTSSEASTTSQTVSSDEDE